MSCEVDESMLFGTDYFAVNCVVFANRTRLESGKLFNMFRKGTVQIIASICANDTMTSGNCIKSLDDFFYPYDANSMPLQ
jgi:hypothetical protein